MHGLNKKKRRSKMINNRNKIAAILALVLLLCMLAALPAAANSAPRYWEGVSASGAILSTGDCPLVVEHEELIFEISEFPANYFNSAEEFLAYDASVRAEYTFYNPTDLQVTATLLFPFGVNPYYVNNYDPETGEYVRIDTSDRFGAQVDGAAVQTTVRHSYWNGSVYHFNPVDEMKTLCDTYRTDNFLAYDLPVYVYKYQFEGVDRQTYSAACAALHVGDLPKGTRLMVDDMRGWHSDEGGESGWLSVSCFDSEAVLYVLGEVEVALLILSNTVTPVGIVTVLRPEYSNAIFLMEVTVSGKSIDSSDEQCENAP